MLGTEPQNGKVEWGGGGQRTACIGSVFVTEERGVTLVFANICNWLNLFRSICSCYNVTLQSDVTYKRRGRAPARGRPCGSPPARG